MKPVSSPRYQQGAIRLAHVLLAVIVIVGLVLLFKKGMIPGASQISNMGNSISRTFTNATQTTTSVSNANANKVDQSINASVASEGEVINDEWTPSSDDNTVYQDTTQYNTTNLIEAKSEPEAEPEPEPEAKPRPRYTEVRQRPQRVTRPAPVYNPPTEFPANLERGYYTVQVYAGYNSKVAYSIRRELEQDGYLVYIYELEDQVGQLFRVRVGRYANLNSARAMRDQIRRRYPQRLSQSFVLMRRPSAE